ncbi:MAG: hypothetical protein KatS3mg105_5178 [Gemmatales bacterium]|nr:MAG: hypothetical protein KatS3mg105_5178 [Gemmatales bacterium]
MRTKNQDRVAYWQRMLAELEASGLSVQAFCRTKNIAAHSLYYWRRKLGGRQALDFDRQPGLGSNRRHALNSGGHQAQDSAMDQALDAGRWHSRRIMAAMKEWMDDKLEKLRPKSPLRGAILYMTSRWDAFTRFLESGDIPLENNAAERAIKLPVIGRKNSLFFGSVAGGHAAMALYSVMATCRRHCIDPSAYLHDVIIRLPTASDEDIDALLPDRWGQSHPEHRITIRAQERTRRATTRRIRRTARRNLATPPSR